MINGVVSYAGGDNDDYVQLVDGLTPQDLEAMKSAFNTGDPSEGRDFIRDRYPRFFNYLFAEGRADWRFFIPLDNQSVVLDIGCGWGSLACEIARESGSVYCVDASRSKLEFVQSRANAEQLNALHTVHADFLDGLPFPDRSFDLIVLNGVLEWAGVFRDELTPESYQGRLLREARRVMKDGGHLYVGIENRLGYWYFFGREDEHAFTVFTTLMPRRVAGWVTWIVHRKPYRAYTYSMKQLEGLLKANGFGACKILSSHPDYRNFKSLIELESSEPLAYYYASLAKSELPAFSIRRLGRALLKDRSAVLLLCLAPFARVFLRLVRKTGLMRHLVPSFSVVARPE